MILRRLPFEIQKSETVRDTKRGSGVAQKWRNPWVFSLGENWIRTLGPPATAELRCGWGRSDAAGDVAADARQQTSSFPGDMLSSATLKARIRLNSGLGPTSSMVIEMRGPCDG